MRKHGIKNNNTEENINNMSDFELARWFAMMDAVNMIADKSEERKMKFEDVDLKPSAIEHYIEATCDIYCRKIMEQKQQKNRSKVLSNIIQQINNINYDKITQCDTYNGEQQTTDSSIFA